MVDKAHKLFQSLALNLPPAPLPGTAPTEIASQRNRQLDAFVQHPEVGLAPQTVISIYRQAEIGWADRQADLFTGVIENDGHLRSVIAARQLAVVGKSWQLNAGDDSPDALTAADTLESALRGVNFRELMGWILGARYYGYSGTEIVWRNRDGVTVPDWFITVPFRRFRFTLEGVPMFRNRVDDGEPLEPGKWVFAENMGELSSQTARSGLMRTCTWYSLFKRWSWRDWTIFAERFGIPLVVGKYPEGATEVEIEKIEEAVENIGEDGQAVHPKDMEIEINEATRSGGGDGLHASIVREANTEMSKLITGSTLLVQPGGQGASFSLGKVHQSRAFDLVVADAAMVQELFMRHVARPFLKWNGFKNVKPPVLQIHVAQEIDPQIRSKIAETLHTMGLILDIDQLRSEFQFRSPPTPERELQPPTTEPSQAERENESRDAV